MLMLFQLQIVVGGTIEGTIVDQESRQPLVGAIVALRDLGLGTHTAGDGRYQFSGVPTGQHVLQVQLLGYVDELDTVSLADSDSMLVHDITLERPWIESTEERDAYHAALEKENRQEAVLSIHVDSFALHGGSVTLFTSMRNNSTLPISLLRVFQCIEPARAIVVDSTGKVVPEQAVWVDCVGEKVFPDSSDVIQIPPSGTIRYPALVVWQYDFTRLPAGVYSAAIEYTYSPPKAFCCYNFRTDYRSRYANNIFTMTSVLRGTYRSENTITILNKPH